MTDALKPFGAPLAPRRLHRYVERNSIVDAVGSVRMVQTPQGVVLVGTGSGGSDVSGLPFGVRIVGDEILITRGRVCIWRPVAQQNWVHDPIGAVGGGLYADSPFTVSGLISGGVTAGATVYLLADLLDDWPTSDTPAVTVEWSTSTAAALEASSTMGIPNDTGTTTASAIRLPLASWDDLATGAGFVQHRIGCIDLPRLG